MDSSRRRDNSLDCRNGFHMDIGELQGFIVCGWINKKQPCLNSSSSIMLWLVSRIVSRFSNFCPSIYFLSGLFVHSSHEIVSSSYPAGIVLSCHEMTSDATKRKEAENKLGKAHLVLQDVIQMSVQILGAVFVKDKILVIIFSQFL